jgi:hypothetical protein
MSDNEMHYFCTYFDSNYLPRGLCLLDSLELHCREFTLAVLCLDELCLERIQGLKRTNVIPVSLVELEAADPELLTVKGERTRLEYYFTCGPSFIRYALNRVPGSDVITYLDADLYFYSNPQPLFDAFKGHSIGVVGHHLPNFRKNTRQGLFNVGWINFRHDADGMACLELWRKQCIEWCYERHEDGKYADQLYLNEWPTLYRGFYEFTHHGANVAAWNVGDYSFSLRDGQIFVDDDPLVFYHFHGFKKIAPHIYNTNLWLHFKAPHPVLKHHVFAEYIEKLEHHSTDQNPTASIRNYRSKFHYLKLVYRCVIGILFRQYIVVFRNR